MLMRARPGSNADEAAGLQALIDRTMHRFIERFGHKPQWGAAAPGRVNLIGDHTDYNQGFALPLAIDRYTVVVASPARPAITTLIAADLNEETRVDLRQALLPQPGSFGAYVLGVVQQYIARGAAVPNLNLMIAGDLPRGAGLASSASLEVAVATMLAQIAEMPLSPHEKALLCQRAEHEFARVPCGIMDMYVVSLARSGHAMLIDCRVNEHEHVPLPPRQEASLLVIDSGIHRSLAAGAYQALRRSCESASAKLGVDSLREAAIEHVEAAALATEEQASARHVIAENSRVLNAAEALRVNDLPALGQAMFASHESLRDRLHVSVPELNIVVEAARRVGQPGGVWGARMTGAGFGGCAIVLGRPDAMDDIRAEISAAFERRFSRQPLMFTTTAVSGAQLLASVEPDPSGVLPF